MKVRPQEVVFTNQKKHRRGQALVSIEFGDHSYILSRKVENEENKVSLWLPLHVKQQKHSWNCSEDKLKFTQSREMVLSNQSHWSRLGPCHPEGWPRHFELELYWIVQWQQFQNLATVHSWNADSLMNNLDNSVEVWRLLELEAYTIIFSFFIRQFQLLLCHVKSILLSALH